MAKVQSYTKSGVDAKFNSRSNMTMVHNGGGSPDVSSYPDAKTGDVIERSSDGARWGVVASTASPIAGRVVSVAGKSGVVTLGPGDVGAAPTSHSHRVDQITGLDIVHNAATSLSVVQRDTSGRITVGTPQVAGHATTKAYVDSAVTAGKAWTAITGKPSTFTPSAHTHTMSQITDLPEVTASVTNSAIVRRWSSGHIMVPTTPEGSLSATSKAYVDNAVTAAKAWSAITGKPSTFTPSAHTHTKAQITDLPTVANHISNNAIVQRTSTGQVQVPISPVDIRDATSKHYVDNKNVSIVLTTEDLNDLVTPGNYVQGLRSNSSIDRNYPVDDTAGHLVVIQGSMLIKQEYTDHKGRYMYYRTKYADVWYPWKSITQTNA